MKLLTIADGFGDSVAKPAWYPGFFKWPEIIKLMTKDLELTNLSRYGAGNEYISQLLMNNVPGNDVALIQWAMPNRLDLVINNDSYWQQQIAADPVYNANTVLINNDQYWISSASRNPNVQEYHKKYIRLRQHQLRSQLFVDYAKMLLDKHNVKHGFLLTVDSSYLSETIKDTSNWVWHDAFKGMHSFRFVSKYADLDAKLKLIQPISLVQFDFISQFIVPKFDLNWRRSVELTAVENMLYRKYKEAIINKDDSF